MISSGNRIDIICLQSDAFYTLIEEVIDRIADKKNAKAYDKWIDDEEAMRLLRITSKTTLQKYRDEGSIRFTQPSKKLILYDYDSIMEFLDHKSKDVF